MKKKVLVAGGLGYIGSHTVVELHAAGFEVIIVDDLSNAHLRILDQLEMILGFKPAFEQFDLCDAQKVAAFAEQHPDISGVIHFAAFKAVGESVQQPLKYYRNNIVNLVNVLESFGNRKLNLVFSSSCTVYGQPEVLPVSEDAAVQKAESPYGNTKQINEEILVETAAVNPNLNVVALRYFNPVGAHHTAWIGELPNGVPANLVPFVTQSAIGKRGAITVYGNDYDTPDGSAVRDYIHVVDLAKAHVAALNRMYEGKQSANFEVFNVGTGNGNTVLEVIHAFEEATGQKLNYTIGERRAGDIEKVWSNTYRSEHVLGWKATHTLHEMMQSAWAWECYLAENKSLFE